MSKKSKLLHEGHLFESELTKEQTIEEINRMENTDGSQNKVKPKRLFF